MPYSRRAPARKRRVVKRRSTSSYGQSKRRKRSSAYALSRTQRTAVRDLIKRGLDADGGIKYYNAEATADSPPYPIKVGNTIWCNGFALLSGKEYDGAVFSYGTQSYISGVDQAMKALNQYRVFTAASASGNKTFQSFRPSNEVTTPVSVETKFLVERTRNVSNVVDATGINHGLADSLPMMVRFVHVRVKAAGSTQQLCDPKFDLFHDSRGLDVGISKAGFGRFNVMASHVNTDKYELLRDESFTLKSPAICATGDSGAGVIIQSFQQPEAPSFHEICIKHKVPSTVTYNLDAPTTGGPAHTADCPVMGPKQEFMLFHYMLMGDAPLNATADKIRITSIPMGKFRD